MKSSVDELDIDQLKNVPTNLSNLKSKVDQLGIWKLKTSLVDLKLSDAVKNDVVKKVAYHEKMENIKSKIPDITKLATNTNLNDKINKLKGKYLILLTHLLLLLLPPLKIKCLMLVI